MAFSFATTTITLAPNAIATSRVCSRRRPRMASIEAPVKEDVRTRLNRLLTLTPTVDTEMENRKARSDDPGKEFKVMLINDETNSREYVARVLINVIPELSKEAAWNIMQKAHTDGSAVVGIWLAEQAEFYADQLKSHNLRASISPA